MSDTIPATLLRAAEREGDRTWLRTDDGELSFAQTVAHVVTVVQRLRDAGIKRGDRVALVTRNRPADLVCWLAIPSLGAVAVTINPASPAGERDALIGQVRPATVIDDAETYAADWRQPVDADASTLGDGVDPDDVAVFIPTSGTTGRSKLVMQTHRAYAYAGEGFPYWMALTRNDRFMTSLPLFHVNAPAYSVMGSLSCGAGLVLLPRFSASDFLDAARRHGATEFNAIGAMLEILMRTPERPDDADTDLRLVYTGPSPAKEWQEVFETRFALRVVCGYAMSESPYGLIWRQGERPFGTLGSLRQHPRLGVINAGRVVDDAGGDLGPGETGELLLKNPVVTPGYFEMPDVTADTIVAGWLHTGDLVTVNADETFTFVARKKEVLRRRGENLSPAEVEDVVAAHPDVLECAVVGVESELTEEDIKAFVVAAPGAAVDFAALRTWTAERLTAFKVPRFWQLIDELPRTPTQRVAKHQLPGGHPPGEYDVEAP